MAASGSAGGSTAAFAACPTAALFPGSTASLGCFSGSTTASSLAGGSTAAFAACPTAGSFSGSTAASGSFSGSTTAFSFAGGRSNELSVCCVADLSEELSELTLSDYSKKNINISIA